MKGGRPRTREVIAALERHGWVWLRTKGSHATFGKESLRIGIVVNHPGDEVDTRTLRALGEIGLWDLKRGLS